ncbi:MAG: hypothetical protein ACK4UN_14725, partial [Limisphaerales bacterium]
RNDGGFSMTTTEIIHEGSLAWENGGRVPFTSFDAEEIDRELDWQNSPLPELLDCSHEKQIVAERLTAYIQYISSAKTIHSAGCRAMALCWLLNPDTFEEGSLKAIAESRGAKKQELHRYLKQLEIVSPGIKSRNARSEQGRENIKEAYHRKKKAGEVAANPALKVETTNDEEGGQHFEK